MSKYAKSWAVIWLWVGAALLGIGILGSCSPQERPLAPETSTWAELREIRRGVTIAAPRSAARELYPRERLVDGSRIRVAEGGLAWLRLDTGATLLIRGPAELQQRPTAVELSSGRVFVDSPPGIITELITPRAPLSLAAVRASVEVKGDGSSESYVLSGEMRSGAGRAQAGERLLVGSTPEPRVVPAVAWEDWTGGLATTDRPPEPSPFGVGTVGARKPGEKGTARFPLAIQKLDVDVSVRGDLAITQVEETFFNPVSESVEGIYSFRTPPGAILESFGVDRGQGLVWGRVKEEKSAAEQYQANVYEGSEEDPALLEWEAPGVYRARLYPVEARATRRIVVRYTEWLARSGEGGKRRLYVYPMAAEGAESSLPHIEELNFSLDLTAAKASSVRTGMAGARRGNRVLVRAQDRVPRADLAVELFDHGPSVRGPEGAGTGAAGLVAYRAKHQSDLLILPHAEQAKARVADAKEPDYWLLPLRAKDLPPGPRGLDLAIVVDGSAATAGTALAVAQASISSLLAHLGKEDRVALWVGSDSLRPVLPRTAQLTGVDAALRDDVQTALGRVEAGGATDLGEMLVAAAKALDPSRRGAVVYLGDGRPTVGELSLGGLQERLSKLPHPARIYAFGLGLGAELPTLVGLARGGFAERVEDGHGAALAALRLLEHAERPVWLGTQVELGASVERAYPRDPSTWVSDETLLLVGRIRGKTDPKQIRLVTPAGELSLPVTVQKLDDDGDLRRRWGLGRVAQLMEEGAGPAALVDVGVRHGLITPVTSFYVPTSREISSEYRDEEVAAEESERPGILARLLAWATGGHRSAAPVMEVEADSKEGGTGTRAKGEEGSMGNPTAPSNKRYAVIGPRDNPDPEVARAGALREAQEFGMIGLLNSGGGAKMAAPAAEREETSMETLGAISGTAAADAPGAGGLGLSGVGEGGGGKGVGLAAIGSIGHGAGTGTGQGFGSGHGRLGGSSATPVPVVRIGAISVSGRLPPEVVQRIVRQNFGRFRMCYEEGLTRNPNLEGSLGLRFTVGTDGSASKVSRQQSELPDLQVATCIMKAVRDLSFPQPEGGTVSVELPIKFSPGKDSGPEGSSPWGVGSVNTRITVTVRDLPRSALFCGDGAGVPLGDRIALWQERLGRVRDSVSGAVSVYNQALRNCEASTPGERSRLLGLMLDFMPSVARRVDLWRAMKDYLGASEFLYRGILARIKTTNEVRELHAALGIKSVESGVLQKTLRDNPAPQDRVLKLEALRRIFPDDLVLTLRLLDALEDVPDLGRARELARELRHREDADALVRTAVGEFYLRLSAQGTDAGQKAQDLAEARHSFGEIVEFAPSDPVGRRRLGDLLRAHGWYADALRQYQTLEQLTPDDPSVALLLAASAQGEGRLEEALRWTEKGRDAGAPDVAQGPAVTARVVASTYLAWGRLEAQQAQRNDELQILSGRARRFLPAGAPEGIRVTLSWVHPDFQPTLWASSQGTPLPASRGDATLGMVEALVPLKEDAFVEVRVEPDDLEGVARLGAEAVLTVVFDELQAKEKIVRMPVRFERRGPASLRFSIRGNEVTRG